MITGAPVNVLDYGADPTGSVDSYTAIQNAINASRNVYLPPGVYSISSTLSVTQSDQTLTGYGATIKNNSNSASVVSLRIGDVLVGTVDRVKIFGLTFDTDNTCGDHLRISRSGQTLIQDCTAQNGGANGFAMVGDCYDVTFFQCVSLDNAEDGFSIVNASGSTANNANQITDCTSIGNRRGIFLYGINHTNRISGGYHEGNGTATAGEQIFIRGGNGNVIENTYVEAQANVNATYGIRVANLAPNTTYNTVIRSSYFAQFDSAYAGIFVEEGYQCIIEDNYSSTGNTFIKVGSGAVRTQVKINTAVDASTYVNDASSNTGIDYPTPTAVTLAIAGSSTAGTQTYSQQTAQWVRSGRSVTVSFALTLSALDVATAGNIRITGLPVACGSVQAGVALSGGGNINLTAGYTQIIGRVTSGQTYIDLFECGDNVAQSAITASQLTSTTTIAGTVTYFV